MTGKTKAIILFIFGIGCMLLVSKPLLWVASEQHQLLGYLFVVWLTIVFLMVSVIYFSDKNPS